jgi:hypothetical protein
MRIFFTPPAKRGFNRLSDRANSYIIHRNIDVNDRGGLA